MMISAPPGLPLLEEAGYGEPIWDNGAARREGRARTPREKGEDGV
jgi:hypothetical protein